MFTDSMGNGLALLVFNNTAFANIGNAGGLLPSSVAGSLYVQGYNANPGHAGDQTTNETSYTGQARAAVARSGAGFTVSGNNVQNAATINLGLCTAGSDTITHVGVGTASSGAGVLLDYSPIISSGAVWLTYNALASGDTLTIIGNPYSVNDRIVLETVVGDTQGTGVTSGTVYWVKTSSGSTVTLSATQGGSTIDITADGAGMAIRATTLAVSNNIQPQIAAGQLNFYFRPTAE